MVRPINRNILSLGVKSAPATKADISVGDDLLETLNANADACVIRISVVEGTVDIGALMTEAET